MNAPGRRPRRTRSSGHTLVTIVFALAANLGVGVLKLIAGLVTGSAAMLSEAAHSVGDTVTEILLLTAHARAGRPADRRHPFGYGKEGYFWALFAAIGIFASGAMFSLYEGARTIAEGQSAEQTAPWLAYTVLALAACLEGTSWVQSVRTLRSEARAQGRGALDYLRRPESPAITTVVLEDSAALTGLALAAAGVSLHHATGSGVWDGLASVLIGILLVAVAYQLARTNKELLVGQQAHSTLVRGIRELLEGRTEVTGVVDLLTMVVGVDRVLLCVRIDFDDRLGAAELERTCVTLGATLRAEFPALDEIFLEPVPRGDPDVLARVRARYGRAFSDPGGPGGPSAPGAGPAQ
ncbi:cation diffusion facilitator family transporter [Nocardiopsis coralliicola]